MTEFASTGPIRSFGVLRRRESRSYILGASLSMMADSVEHVITYWVLWQVFASPILVGFQIVSHWLPYLLFSVYAGALAERFDCRRIIQAAQILFMGVSLAWGVLFLTGTLELWHACVLLVLHGLAGCVWVPAEQLMLYEFAGPRELPSAIRINATFQSLGFLVGPVVGSLLLFLLEPGHGMLINVLFFIPLTVFLWRTRVTGHGRRGEEKLTTPPSLLGVLRVFGTVKQHRNILAMVILTALSAITIGATLQNAMPAFADSLDIGFGADLGYGVLLFAHGIGAVVGGVLLEATGRVPASVRTAIVSSIVLGVSTVLFALSGSFWFAVAALIIAGLAQITSESTEMSVVQLEAPDGERGRIIGAYTMFGPGMMTFSGVTIGVLGSLMTVPHAVLVSGIVLAVGALAVGVWRFSTR